MKILSIIYNKRLLRILFWIWFVIIIVLADIPNLTTGRDRLHEWGFEIRLDYIAHFLLYFVFSFLFICWKVDEKFNINELLLLGFIIGGLVLGVVDEYHQKVVPGRTFNPVDMFYNVLGLVCGIIVTYVFIKRFLVPRN